MNNDQVPSLFIPSLGKLYAMGACAMWPVFRFIAGANLVPHGWNKIFGENGVDGFAGYLANSLGLMMPHVFAWAATLTELVGGVLIAIGLFTRPAAAAAVILMAVIMFGVHWDEGFFNNNSGYEYPMLWLTCLLLIFFCGAKHCSFDRLMGREV